MNSRAGLRAFLTLLGAVMVVAGGITIAFGAEIIPNSGVVAPDVDSEMRFYAVWYSAAGLSLLAATRRLEEARATVRMVGVAFFAAGCARALSWAMVGRPHPLAITLMVIELLLPLAIIPWQASVAANATRVKP